MTSGQRSVTVETTIDRPPEAVFEYLSDPRNEPSWCPSTADVRVEERGADGRWRYTFVQTVGPFRRRESAEMVEAERPGRLRWRFGAFGSTVESTIELRADGAGTHLTQTNVVYCSRLQWLVQVRVARRELPDQLVLLKAILEAGEVPSTGR